MFSGKDVPAVGVSIGIERVFAIMERQAEERSKALNAEGGSGGAGVVIRATETQVLVASIGNGMQVKRMEVASMLWRAGIKAEFGYKPNPKMGDQLNHAFDSGIPYMVLFGEDELSRGVVKVKDIAAKSEEAVPYEGLVEYLSSKLLQTLSLLSVTSALASASLQETATPTPAVT
ncbi:hypothetical protein CEUSTIGMA_g5838.t1 [Chlamydomonas eustigma]|uniref:Anticodon-binding domain-containing protein n=1 Tax=Chlamydomonas eustigma TaxID=1157962 RepID=A0A250X5S6_9CHLO|nr:hypothetical protein CEUSTIGMA_g5838.t1 [Chlamydomonas eustigma]|eukprot:GAX78396.1 hypothetical protein CEUSTIGMA_g5838.t1 [Chlamydomonas eustigma]